MQTTYNSVSSRAPSELRLVFINARNAVYPNGNCEHLHAHFLHWRARSDLVERAGFVIHGSVLVLSLCSDHSLRKFRRSSRNLHQAFSPENSAHEDVAS